MERREYLSRAEELEEGGKLEEAVSLLKECREAYPDFLVARLYLAKLLHLIQRDEEAIQELEFVLSRRPNTLGALKLLGEILFARGRYREAKDVYLKVNFLDPFDDEVGKTLQKINALLEKEVQAEAVEEESPFELPQEPPEVSSPEEAPEEFKEEEEEFEVEEETQEKEEEVFETESMALVFLKQGEIDRAEEIYKKLALRNPHLEKKLKTLRAIKILSRMKERLGGINHV